jgi:hypothetical protein
MQTIPNYGTKIWASVVFPGMIIRTPDGTRIEVVEISEGYNTWTFGNGCGRKVKVDYAALVEVLGYFNP